MSEEDDTPCPYVTGTVTRYCTLTPFTLTDAEREAVDDGVRCVEYVAAHGQPARADLASSAATLRGLLERTGCTKNGTAG